VSKRRGKSSNHSLGTAVREDALKLIRRHYHDFGPTLAHEKLTEEHGLRLSVESVRGLMMGAGLWRTKRARQVTVHQMRERRRCRGELVQIDGSRHDWFEGRAEWCSLLVFIDDATGELLEMQFVGAETTADYFASVARHLERDGRPLAYYSDKHGIFHINNPTAVGGTGETQLGRALRELEIQLICANTPQAKGRVERVHQTLQDRLVKELRLRDICSMAAANTYLPEFMADLNRRFAVAPRCDNDAHRAVPVGTHLERILTTVEDRKLTKNLILQFEKVNYQVQTSRPRYALRHATVQVRRDRGGKVVLEYKGQQLAYTIFERQSRQGEVVSAKQLDGSMPLMSASLKPAPPRPSPSLGSDHPWRKSMLSPRAALKAKRRAELMALTG
jgi:hypothetical protein